MNKTIIYTLVLALMGGVIFAGGEAESSSNNYRPGFAQEARELEIISLKGDMLTDSYGNPMVSQGGKNYLIRVAPTLDFDLTGVNSVEGEGVIGRTVYTKDGKDFVDFYLTLVEVDGETRTVDLSRIQGYGVMGRNSFNKKGMAGRGTMGRDNRGYDMDDDHWGYRYDSDETRGTLAPRGMMGYDVTEGEELSLSGSLTLYKEIYPMIATNEGNYVLMLGHDYDDDWKDGMNVEVTGFTGHTLYSEEGEDYYAFMVTSAVIDGKEVEMEHMTFNGEDGFRGSRMNGMMPRGGRSFRN